MLHAALNLDQGLYDIYIVVQPKMSSHSPQCPQKWGRSECSFLGELYLKLFVENAPTFVQGNMHQNCNKEFNKCERKAEKHKHYVCETVHLCKTGCPQTLKCYHQKATFIKTSASLPVCCHRVHK